MLDVGRPAVTARPGGGSIRRSSFPCGKRQRGRVTNALGTHVSGSAREDGAQVIDGGLSALGGTTYATSRESGHLRPSDAAAWLRQDIAQPGLHLARSRGGRGSH